MKTFQDKHEKQMFNQIEKNYPEYTFGGYFLKDETKRIVKLVDSVIGGGAMVEYYLNESTGRLKTRFISYL